MNGIKSFSFHPEYFELIDNLSTAEEKGEVLLAILEYVFYDKEPKLDGMSRAVFNNLKKNLDFSKAQSNRRRKNQIETELKPNQNRIRTEQEPNENRIETDIYIINNREDNIDRDRDRGMGEEKEEGKEEEKENIYRQIVEYLNSKLNSKYKYTSKLTRSKINARLNEGYKLDDFIVVIDKKVDEWKGTEFEKYLCPDTLFGTKFEKYLNQKIVDKPTGKEKNVKKFQEYQQREYENMDEFYDDL